VFILREPLIKNRKILYENYVGMFPTFESFCQVLDQCTENYECLVVVQSAKTNTLQDMVFWYKANEHKAFRLCSPHWWEKKSGGNPGGHTEYENGLIKKKPSPFNTINKLK
jgi:hypothetical protein